MKIIHQNSNNPIINIKFLDFELKKSDQTLKKQGLIAMTSLDKILIFRARPSGEKFDKVKGFAVPE